MPGHRRFWGWGSAIRALVAGDGVATRPVSDLHYAMEELILNHWGDREPCCLPAT